MMKRKQRGFTLFEMLLVLAIMSAAITMIMGFMQQKAEELRRDRAALQMQQILNAGLSYYLSSSPGTQALWPPTGIAGITALSPTYLPAGFVNKNPWGQTYQVTSLPTDPLFTVQTSTIAAVEATILSGRLPLSTVTGTTVTASVSIPGQNLNNARSVNFASVYHSGSCVPAPVCPNGMAPNIMVVPAGANGVSDAPTSCGSASDPTTCTPFNEYPISGYTAFATGPAATPTDCTGGGATTCIANQIGTWPTFLGAAPTGSAGYYRVCLSVTTSKGLVAPTGTNSVAWGKAMGNVMALTRCVPVSGDAPSSDFTVWSQ